MARSGDVPGSRLLPAYRAATRQSGSPPDDALGMQYQGTFSGAACCLPTELPRYKAAPLHVMRWAAVTVEGHQSLLTSHFSLRPLGDSVHFSEWMSVEKIRLDPAELGSIVDLDAHVEIERANGGPLVEQNVFSSS
jgi:hypothetical protein